MKRLQLALFILLCVACSEPKPPNDILDMKQMSSLVQDITLIETHYQSKYGAPSQYKKALDQSVKKILQKQGVTLRQFEKSLAYYAAHPHLQKALNERLLMQLSRKTK